MFSHLVLGANDIEATRQFYDAALGALGYEPGMVLVEGEKLLYQGNGGMLLITKPRDGKPATAANGGTIGLTAASDEAVDNFHAAGLANGGSDEGAPGPRDAIPGSYAAYLRDPTGNKLVAWRAPA
ncbi:VOC family protein [Mangrovimicrobium sediminis]|uniref:VOC family protein n=1 Tax=Mangrovimicrobium sediminis TaxID=2562682 RepID=A0A4Z0M582_9GAMM|nr:VOC family protein [Haliea sp. SAOS-164]TGD74641.1 VOC family protein [Haliea sp. SAOS-164]